MRKQSFLPGIKPQNLAHGGHLRAGRRKIARPFSHRLPIHVVLKSHRARGAWSLLTHKTRVESLLTKYSKLYGIKIYSHANVGNHIHLLIQTTARSYSLAKAQFQSFLRRFSGELAFQIMGAKKGAARGRFWDGLAFTRLINWGRDFAQTQAYLYKNLFEAAGLWNRKRNPDWEIVSLFRDG